MEVGRMDIEKIAIKIAKVRTKLAQIQKAGTQAKLWAAIGEQHAVGLIPHQSVGQKVLNAASVFRLASYSRKNFQDFSTPRKVC